MAQKFSKFAIGSSALVLGLLCGTQAQSAPAVFFNDSLANGLSTFNTTIAAADQAYNAANPQSVRASTIYAIDIGNSTTDSAGVFSVTSGTSTIWVRTTQAGAPALNASNGDLGGDGFTNWGNTYDPTFNAGAGRPSQGLAPTFSDAAALGYSLEFFSDASLTNPFQMNALGLHVNDWGTCCVLNNPTPSGGTTNASEIYLGFDQSSPLLLGGISTPGTNIEHFIGAINDTNFFTSVHLTATGNGEAFGAGGFLTFSSVALNSVPAGSSFVTLGSRDITASNDTVAGLGSVTTRRFDGGTLLAADDTGSFTISNNGGFIDAVGATSTFSGTFADDNTDIGHLTIQDSIGGGVVELTGANTHSGGTTVLAGATLSIPDAAALGTGTLSLLGSPTVAATLRVTGSTTITNHITVAGDPVFDIAGGATVTVSGGIADDATGAGDVVKQGDGTLVLSGTNTYTGGTFVDAGILQAAATNTLPVGQAVTVGATGTLDLAGYNQSISTLAGAGATTLGSATLTLSNAVDTFSGVISGTGALSVSGGSEVLTGTNTYSGGTTIASGATLALSGAGSVAASSGVADNGTFDIAATTSGATIKTLSGTGAVTLGGKTLSLSAAADTFSGVISGTGALTVSGGSEVLTGTNTYSGGTTIASGATLTLGAAGTTGVIAGNVVDNGSLVINRSNDLTFAGTISGTGSLRKVGANVLTLTATNNSYSGGTTVAAGGLKGDSRALQGAIVDNGSVEFTQAVDGTYAGALTGTGTLTKSGVGALTLSGTSAITGATAVTGGKLSLQGQLGTSAATISTGATLAGTGTLVGNLVVNAGGTLAPGNSPGTLTVTGNATLNAGSSFVTEIDGRTYAAAGGSGSYDRLVVTGTTGTFNPGGTIVPVLRGISGAATNAFNPVYGDRFTVATAAIIGAGAFSAVQQPTTGLPTNSRFDVLYNTGNVQLVLTPGSYAALGQSDGWLQDGINAAAGLDAVRPAAGARNGALPSLFNGLYGMDRDHLGLAFQQVSGEIHADALQSEAGNIALLGQTVQDAGQGAFDNQANSGYAHLWGQVIGRSTTASQDRVATRYTDSSYGFLLGYAQVKDGNRFGIAAGYLQGHVNNAIGGRATSDSGTIYVYGNYELGNNLSVNGTLGYVFGRILTTRVLTLSTGTSTAASRSGYGAVNADAQLRYKADLSDKVAAAVFAGLDFTSISAEAVNETNAADASLALSLAKKTWETARSSIGGSLSYAYDAKTQIAASASWNHTLSGLPTAQRNVTLGAANWMVSSVIAGRDTMGLGASLTSELTDSVAIKLGYTGQFDGKKYVSHSGNLVLSMKF